MLLETTKSALSVQPLFVTVHVKVFAPSAKLVTGVSTCVELLIKAVPPNATVQTPVPTCGVFAPKVAVVLHKPKSLITTAVDGRSLTIVTSSESEQPLSVTVHTNTFCPKLFAKPVTVEL